ncbi:MAG: dihydropteroate synthase, partial [Microlunatus sp.]|nr:dihydropteroate synthase [Microlunatus sp.]
MTYLPPIAVPVRTIGGRSFDFEHQIVVMGIVNRTPDSFYDDGSTFALDAAVAAGQRARSYGADWVDVGGVPFSPDVP